MDKPWEVYDMLTCKDWAIEYDRKLAYLRLCEYKKYFTNNSIQDLKNFERLDIWLQIADTQLLRDCATFSPGDCFLRFVALVKRYEYLRKLPKNERILQHWGAYRQFRAYEREINNYH